MPALVDATIEDYLAYGDRDDKKIQKQALDECAEGTPDAIASMWSIAKDRFIAQAAQVYSEYKNVFEVEKGRFEGEISTIKLRLEQTFSAEQAAARVKKKEELEKLNQSLGPSSPKYEECARNVERAQTELDLVRARLHGRPLRTSLEKIYLPFMVALAVLEAPVNRLSFELFFQESGAISLLLALLVGAALVFFAHMIGTGLRQIGSPRTRWLLVLQIALILTAFLISIVLIYFVAIARQQFVDLIEQEASSSLADAIRGVGSISDVASVLASTSLSQTGKTFLTINLVVFVLGILAATVRHDPDQDYEPAFQRLTKAEKQLSILKSNHNKAVTRATEQHNEIINAVESRIQEAELREKNVRSELEQLKDKKQNDISQIASITRRKILAYQAGCQRAVNKSGAGSLSLEVPNAETIRKNIELQAQ